MAALICGIQPGEDALFRCLSVNMSHFIICTQTGNSSYTATALTHVGCITMAQKHQKGHRTCPAIHLHTHPTVTCFLFHKTLLHHKYQVPLVPDSFLPRTQRFLRPLIICVFIAESLIDHVIQSNDVLGLRRLHRDSRYT